MKLPVALWDYIESQYGKKVVEGKVVDEKEALRPVEGEGSEEGTAPGEGDELVRSKKIDVSLKHMSLNVLLKEFHPGVLGGNNLNLEFASGGGNLDLKPFVVPKGGSFYFKIVLQYDVVPEEGDYLHVMYLGKGKKRKIGKKIFGSGCEKYFDITDYFKKTINQRGMLVSTEKKTHITVLAGTYIILLRKGDVHYITQLTVTDSRYRILQCE